MDYLKWFGIGTAVVAVLWVTEKTIARLPDNVKINLITAFWLIVAAVLVGMSLWGLFG